MALSRKSISLRKDEHSSLRATSSCCSVHIDHVEDGLVDMSGPPPALQMSTHDPSTRTDGMLSINAALMSCPELGRSSLDGPLIKVEGRRFAGKQRGRVLQTDCIQAVVGQPPSRDLRQLLLDLVIPTRIARSASVRSLCASARRSSLRW
jgi:hypothetical protein